MIGDRPVEAVGTPVGAPAQDGIYKKPFVAVVPSAPDPRMKFCVASTVNARLMAPVYNLMAAPATFPADNSNMPANEACSLPKQVRVPPRVLPVSPPPEIARYPVSEPSLVACVITAVAELRAIFPAKVASKDGPRVS